MFLKDFLKKLILKKKHIKNKNQQATTKAWKLPSMQRVTQITDPLFLTQTTNISKETSPKDFELTSWL